MAIVSMSTFYNAVAPLVQQQIENTMNNKRTLLGNIRRVEGDPGGPQQVVHATDSTASWYTPGGTFPSADAKTNVRAYERYAAIGASFDIADIQALAESGDPSRFIYSFWRDQMQAKIQAALNKLSAGVMTGDGPSATPDEISGMDVAVDDGNTYMSLDRATYTRFASYLYPGASGAISAAMMDAVVNKLAFEYGADLNTGRWAWLMDRTQERKCAALTTTALTTSITRTNAPVETYIGVANVFHNSAGPAIPVIPLYGYPAQVAHLVNLDALELHILTGTATLDGAGTPFGDSVATLDSPFRWLTPDISGDKATMKLAGYFQLMLRNPRMNAAGIEALAA